MWSNWAALGLMTGGGTEAGGTTEDWGVSSRGREPSWRPLEPSPAPSGAETSSDRRAASAARSLRRSSSVLDMELLPYDAGQLRVDVVGIRAGPVVQQRLALVTGVLDDGPARHLTQLLEGQALHRASPAIAGPRVVRLAGEPAERVYGVPAVVVQRRHLRHQHVERLQ